MLEIFRDRRPEVVFHAAALKHVGAGGVPAGGGRRTPWVL